MCDLRAFCLYFCLLNTADSIQNICWWLYSNRGPLVSEATALSTVPQPLPWNCTISQNSILCPISGSYLDELNLDPFDCNKSRKSSGFSETTNKSRQYSGYDVNSKSRNCSGNSISAGLVCSGTYTTGSRYTCDLGYKVCLTLAYWSGTLQL